MTFVFLRDFAAALDSAPAMEKPRLILPAGVGGPAAEPDEERRISLRYGVSLAAKFLWNGPDGIEQEGQGTTRDVSAIGALIASAAHPAVGNKVEFEIVVRADAIRGTVKLRAQGRVVRTSGDTFAGKCGGFAVLSDGFHLFRGCAESCDD